MARKFTRRKRAPNPSGPGYVNLYERKREPAPVNGAKRLRLARNDYLAMQQYLQAQADNRSVEHYHT